MTTSRPNILFIMTDQQSGSALSCTGNEDVRTPAMDGLAERGVRFDQTYCTFPLCVPSRASMLTGLMPHELEMMGNQVRLPDWAGPMMLGNLLDEAGYHCAYGGKWHVPEVEVPEGVGFEKICGHDDRHLAERCIEFLGRRHDKPFFLVAGYDNPHNICEWARSQHLPWGDIAEVATEECPSLPANFSIAPFEPDIIRVEQRASYREYPSVSFSDDNWRHYRHAYFRLVEKVDAEIGRILDALGKGGLDRDTLVIFTSDHGDGMGAHHWNQKSVFYEEVVRVPMMLSFPGVIRAGGVDEEHLVSNGLDIVPTVCDYVGIKPARELPGLSLRNLAEGNDVGQWREELIAQTTFPPPLHRLGTEGRMMRTQRYKYVIYLTGRYREQLFDLERDPGEMVNLAVNARYGEILVDHRRRLLQWCYKHDDAWGRRLFESYYVYADKQ